MLSDSIHTTINALLSEIKYYSKSPFNYGTEPEYKTKFIEALANLFFILHTLDHVPIVDMDIARMSAHEAWNDIVNPLSNEESQPDSLFELTQPITLTREQTLFSKAVDSARLNKLACSNK